MALDTSSCNCFNIRRHNPPCTQHSPNAAVAARHSDTAYTLNAEICNMLQCMRHIALEV